MPMPLLKLLFLLVSLACLLLILLYVSLSVNFPLSASPSFFPTSAIISLAEDNSTFFLSKPAAFGPLLPKKGLTGELFVLAETELGCEDSSPDGFQWRGTDLSSDGLDIEPKPSSHHEATAGELQDGVEPPSQGIVGMDGKIVLIRRGGCGFYEKVLWSQRRGAMAVIVGDNEAHRPLLTMYAKGDTSNITIPAIFTSFTTASLLTSLLPKHPPKAHSHKRPGYPPKPTYSPRPSGIPYDGAYEELDYGLPLADPDDGGNHALGAHDELGNSVTDGSVEVQGSGWLGQSDDPEGEPNPDQPDMSHGLWVTLTPTKLSSSPFVDTLLVLVVSPLITLTVVYTMLLLRSRYRRRRWRAPKSIVDQLPVHTYQPPSDPPSPTAPQDIPSSPEVNARQESEKSPTGSLNPSSFPNANQVSTSASSSAFPPLIRVSSAPQPQTSTPKKPRMSRRRMQVLPGFKYFPPSPECVVCLEEYEDGVSQVMRLPCGHEFHVNCITPWLTTRRRTCPVCKCDVVKALGGGNGYSTGSGDEESATPADARPNGGVEGRGERGMDVWWRAFMGAMGIEGVGRGNEVGERTPLIEGENPDTRRID